MSVYIVNKLLHNRYKSQLVITGGINDTMPVLVLGMLYCDLSLSLLDSSDASTI